MEVFRNKIGQGYFTQNFVDRFFLNSIFYDAVDTKLCTAKIRISKTKQRYLLLAIYRSSLQIFLVFLSFFACLHAWCRNVTVVYCAALVVVITSQSCRCLVAMSPPSLHTWKCFPWGTFGVYFG